MELQRMLSQTRRVRNRILSWVNGTKFDPTKLRGVLLGLLVNIAIGEVCCYRLVQQDIRAGELPSFTADLMIVIFAVFEAVVAPLVSWWGFTKRRKLLIGYATAVVVCCFTWFLMPAKFEREESELCNPANSKNDIGFIGTSARTVYRLLIITYSCILFVLARVVFLSHGIAYSDEYAPDRTSMHFGVLLISRIFPLVLGYKVLTSVVESNMVFQILMLAIGSFVSLVQMPLAIPNKAPIVNGVQMEALPITDRGLCTSIGRVLNNPIAMTQMFAMGLVSASLWGYGYYELDIVKYAGAVFSAPILMEFCKLKAIKQAAITSVLMFVFYILITVIPSCDTGIVSGLGKSYYGHLECSLACNCKPQWEEFKPICAVDTMVSYVSPCQAGCRESREINGIQVYTNCTCAAAGRVLERACGDASCRSEQLLHGFMYNILVTFAILVFQVQGVLLLKVVDVRDKSVVMGVASSFIAIMTFVVGHLIFYTIQVNTCRWFEGNKCHLQSEAFPYLVGATCAFLVLTSIITTVTSWHFFKMSNKDKNEDNVTRL
ncbi:unnamed protein product [Euphydryas editha]|uniref:Kazal-like domain-containing protein n=1 Tax=Euphydryas editha TaxID=104508 RepID=A0AAU9UC35_EUPED|nr:unnamed protein product [Euphydryas editha]